MYTTTYIRLQINVVRTLNSVNVYMKMKFSVVGGEIKMWYLPNKLVEEVRIGLCFEAMMDGMIEVWQCANEIDTELRFSCLSVEEELFQNARLSKTVHGQTNMKNFTVGEEQLRRIHFLRS